MQSILLDGITVLVIDESRDPVEIEAYLLQVPATAAKHSEVTATSTRNEPLGRRLAQGYVEVAAPPVPSGTGGDGPVAQVVQPRCRCAR